MKYLSLILISILFYTSSCNICTDELRLGALYVKYNDLESSMLLYVYSNDNDNNDLYELNSDNDFTYKIILNSENSNPEFSLVLGDSLEIDTFSEISYNLTGRCNNKIENFQYKHNGLLKTAYQIEL